jgi:hypothetical protein
MKKIRVSFSAIIIAFLFLLILIPAVRKYQSNIISWDTFGYYLYLPATFIWNDPGLKNTVPASDAATKYNLSATLYQLVPHESGNNIIKYSSGMAVLFSPFFFTAHLFAIAGPASADGFSSPYQFSIFLSSLIFILLGLLYLRKILIHLFDDKTAGIVIFLLVAGTNLLFTFTFLTTIHLYLFAIYTVFIWKVIQWHEDPGKGKAICIGLLGGLLVLIRPTEAICAFIPLLWGVWDMNTFRKKITLFYTYKTHLLLMILFSIIALLPQFIYWKLFTGSFFFYSYDNPGEGLDFFTPYLTEVLFSFRKGWFVYTPMMLIALGGFVVLYRSYKKTFYPLLFFTLINIYLVSCWTCWWYAGSFGQRAMVQSYAVLAIPLGALIFDVLQRKRLFTWLLFFIIGLMTLLNVFQTWQYNRGIIDSSRMTKAYYWAVFGKTGTVDPETQKLLLVNRSTGEQEEFRNKDLYFLKTTYLVDFHNMPDIPADRFITLDSSGTTCFQLDSSYIFTPAWKKPFINMTRADHLFIYVKSRIYPISDPKTNPLSLAVMFEHKNKPYKYRTLDTDRNSGELILNQWNNIEMLYLTPDIRSEFDNFSVYFWHRGPYPVLVDNISIEIWEPERGW